MSPHGLDGPQGNPVLHRDDLQLSVSLTPPGLPLDVGNVRPLPQARTAFDCPSGLDPVPSQRSAHREASFPLASHDSALTASTPTSRRLAPGPHPQPRDEPAFRVARLDGNGMNAYNVNPSTHCLQTPPGDEAGGVPISPSLYMYTGSASQAQQTGYGHPRPSQAPEQLVYATPIYAHSQIGSSHSRDNIPRALSASHGYNQAARDGSHYPHSSQRSGLTLGPPTHHNQLATQNRPAYRGYGQSTQYQNLIGQEHPQASQTSLTASPTLVASVQNNAPVVQVHRPSVPGHPPMIVGDALPHHSLLQQPFAVPNMRALQNWILNGTVASNVDLTAVLNDPRVQAAVQHFIQHFNGRGNIQHLGQAPARCANNHVTGPSHAALLHARHYPTNQSAAVAPGQIARRSHGIGCTKHPYNPFPDLTARQIIQQHPARVCGGCLLYICDSERWRGSEVLSTMLHYHPNFPSFQGKSRKTLSDRVKQGISRSEQKARELETAAIEANKYKRCKECWLRKCPCSFREDGVAGVLLTDEGCEQCRANGRNCSVIARDHTTDKDTLKKLRKTAADSYVNAVLTLRAKDE